MSVIAQVRIALVFKLTYHSESESNSFTKFDVEFEAIFRWQIVVWFGGISSIAVEQLEG